MINILIIGANSYIGVSFEQYIKYSKLFNVYKVGASNDEWKEIDFVKFDVVLHTAAIVHKRERKRDSELYYKVNRDLAYEVASKAKASGVKQFILISTASVYGRNASRITKNTLPNPDTIYGKSKLEGENLVNTLADDKYKVVILRPPMVYGYGCKGNFNKLITLLDKLPIFPEIQNKRSMIYIDNLCEFIKQIILIKGMGYFFPQNDDYICTSYLVKEIVSAKKKKIYIIKGFKWIISILVSRNNYFKKVFGDCFYDKEMSFLGDHSFGYCKKTFIESVHESIHLNY